MTIKEENHLDALSRKHRELDKLITEMQNRESFDDLELANLKQQKLKIKDEIFAFKRQLATNILSGEEQ